MNIPSFFILIIAISCFDNVNCRCVWEFNQLTSDTLPLLLHYTNGPRRLYHPIGNSTIELKSDESLTAVCNGNNNYVIFIPSISRSVQKTITCVGGVQIKVDGRHGDVRNLRCATQLAEDVDNTGRVCVGSDGPPAKRGVELIIGFRVSAVLVPHLTVCYDFNSHIPLYVNSTLRGSSINARYKGDLNKRQFKHAGSGVAEATWNQIYYRNRQQTNLMNDLGPNYAAKYTMNGSNFLNRGHLAPRADDFFPYTQNATYNYVNAAPQWMTINSGTWGEIEDAVRNHAASIREDFTMYTGTYGQLELNTDRNYRFPIYLRDETTRTRVSVPKYFWKLVCNAANQCISYVTLNDPLGGDMYRDWLCNDISRERLWLRNTNKGRGACCVSTDLFNRMKMTPPHPHKIDENNPLKCNI